MGFLWYAAFRDAFVETIHSLRLTVTSKTWVQGMHSFLVTCCSTAKSYLFSISYAKKKILFHMQLPNFLIPTVKMFKNLLASHKDVNHGNSKWIAGIVC